MAKRRSTSGARTASPKNRPRRPAKAEPRIRVGIDTGGTFTDLVAIGPRLRVAFKIPSTPDHPEQAVVAALDELLRRVPSLREAALAIVHGSTVATNTLLEGKGARVALVTNEGFEDVIEIGRQARQELYSLNPSRPTPLVARRNRIGVRQRSTAEGDSLQEPAPAELDALVETLRRRRPEAIAIGLLHSYADPGPEQRLERRLRKLGLPLTRSSDVAPLFREYERLSTTVANAALLPGVRGYLERLQGRLGDRELAIQQSNGGLTSVRDAARYPVRMVLSGPAGGVHAAERILREASVDTAISFDMGGTSTDVGWIQGSARRTDQLEIGGRPLVMDSMEIHTIGAGGGSLVWIDDGGALRVGPRSAGADPGPACYGRGELPTVSDCHLVLGRLPGDRVLGDSIHLDVERSRRALTPLAEKLRVEVMELAARVLDVADATMSKAIKHISLERGHDPREHALFAFGGAGGLHANRLAAGLGMREVLIPAFPGATSAFGMAVSDARFDQSRGLVRELGERPERELGEAVRELEEAARRRLLDELGDGPVKVDTRVACRYLGQSYELGIRFGQGLRRRFEEAHQQRYGFTLEQPLECVALHATAVRQASRKGHRARDAAPHRARPQGRLVVAFPEGRDQPAVPRETPLYERESLAPGARARGPCIVVEETSTSVVEAGWDFEVDAFDNLRLLDRSFSGRSR